jgi:hypothetical protein
VTTASTASPAPTAPPGSALRVERRPTPLTLEGVRGLAASDQGLALLSSGSVVVPVGVDLVESRAVLHVADGVSRGVPWRDGSVLVAGPTGSLELVAPSAAGARVIEKAPSSGRSAHVRALAGHAGAGRVAVARRAGPVAVASIDAPGAAGLGAQWALGDTTGGFVTALAFDAKGERLAVASLGADGQGRVGVYRVSSEPVLERVIDDAGPLAVAWVTGSMLALGGVHGEVSLVDLESGRHARTFQAFEDEVCSLVHVAGTDLVLAFGDDRKLESGPFSGSVVVHDGGGGTFWFAVKPRPRVLAWAARGLAAGELVPMIDAPTLDLARLH